MINKSRRQQFMKYLNVFLKIRELINIYSEIQTSAINELITITNVIEFVHVIL